MIRNQITLDEEADKLFQELGGIDKKSRASLPSYLPEDYDEGLREEEMRLDTCRILLIELMHLISVYFRDVQYWEGAKKEDAHFNAIVNVLRELANIPDHDGTMLIRYRGFPMDPNRPPRNDYAILFGDRRLDLDMIPSIVKRQGTSATHLGGRLGKAFDTFTARGINNIHMKVMAENPAVLDRLLVSLRILSRYHQALENDAPIVFEKNREKASVIICKDEQGKPDINLTIVSGLNDLNASTMQGLVQKVDQWMQRSQSSNSWEPHSSIFNVMFSIKNLKEKLFEPPIAVNNIKWLMADKSYAGISKEKAQVVRMVVDCFGGTPQDTMRILNSVYGNDFEKISSQHVLSRLQSATDLITRIQQKAKGQRYEQEVLQNVQGRMDIVKDTVFEEMTIQKDGVSIFSEGKETFFDKINTKLMGLLVFCNRRSKTRRKIKSIFTNTIDFDAQDFETIARDFDISVEAAEHLIMLLKNCFDGEGHFRRRVFEKNIPEFIQHDRKVFEFLWHYTKVTPHRNDRVAFLNSLQLLTSKMRKPQRALSVLITDFIDDPGKVTYADRNGLMLSTLFLRKYNKELNLDIEITPEEILLVKEGLDQEVVNDVTILIGNIQSSLYEKIRTIHKEVTMALDTHLDSDDSMPLRYLLSLEREVHIFLSLLRGNVVRSVLRNAVKIYGFPESAIYRLRESRRNISAFLQHLKVAIRGLGRVGELKDIALLEEIRGSESGFLALGKGKMHEELIRRVMEWADVTRYNLSHK